MAKTYPVMKGRRPSIFPEMRSGSWYSMVSPEPPKACGGLGEYLAKCGFTVYGPRLKGHGTHYEEMEGTTWKDWIESADDGYRMLKKKCSQIFVVGLSMGGTLAVELAHRHPEIREMVLINAAMKMDSLDEWHWRRDPDSWMLSVPTFERRESKSLPTKKLR